MDDYVLDIENKVKYDLSWFEFFIYHNSKNFTLCEYTADLFKIFRPVGQKPIKWTNENKQKYKGIYELGLELEKIGLTDQLNNVCYFGKMGKNEFISEHADPNRGCNLVLPLTDSCIIQYKKIGTYKLEDYLNIDPYGTNNGTVRPTKDLPIKYQYNGPTIINAKIPHQVINRADTDRNVFYWSIKENFNDVKQCLKN